MEKTFRTVQFAANIGIIAIAILLAVVVIKQYVLYAKPPEPSNFAPPVFASSVPLVPTAKPAIGDLIGKTVPLDGVDWKGNESTLVLYISTTCHFCNESSPFYQRLAKEKAKIGVKLVAVLSQSTDEAMKYLNDRQIKVDQILNASLSSIGVTATPTLTLVDKTGVVSNFWRGKLNEEKEAEVIGKLSRQS